MYHLDRRIARIIRELEQLIVRQSQPVGDLQMRVGVIDKTVPVRSITDGFAPYTCGTVWAGHESETYALFRGTVTVPADLRGDDVYLNVKTNKRGWDALNPQMLLYINGAPFHGLDVNHTEVKLPRALQDQPIEIDIYAFSGINNSYHLAVNDVTAGVTLYVDLMRRDADVERLYYDLKTPYAFIAELNKTGTCGDRIVDVLNDAVNLIDLREPYGEHCTRSLRAASAYIDDNIYGHGDGVATLVGHTHIDVAWLWQYKHTRDKTARSYATALRMLDNYHGHIFMGPQAQLYQYLKEDYPDLFAEIKQAVADGRWEVEGAMWVEPDMNMPSGESLVRQLLFGKTFYMDEFGVESRVLWLPDVFGYSAALPQILKKAGVDYFMTAKLHNNEVNRMPHDTIMWHGIDGTGILTQLCTYSPSAYNADPEKGDVLVAWKNYKDKHINDDILMSFGYGDGGGGPTRGMVESIDRLSKGIKGLPRVRIGAVGEYFDRLQERVGDHPRLPKWVGELYYELHRGTYTSMARVKRQNRKAECLLNETEFLCSLAQMYAGQAYPKDALNALWRDVLCNQFHDVLPGSSIKPVYDDTDVIYANVFDKAHDVYNDALAAIQTKLCADGDSVVVVNPLSFTRDTAVTFAYDGDCAALERDGVQYACQRYGGNVTAYVKGVPAKSVAVFRIVSQAAVATAALTVTTSRLENQFYIIEVDDSGAFTRIYDKRADREVLPYGAKANVLQAFEDKPFREDNWNLDVFYAEKQYPMDGAVELSVVECGAVRGVFRVTRTFMSSTITQDVILYADSPRIDFATVMDWHEKDVVVKAAFPVDVNAQSATYEVQFGHLSRPTHRNTSWDEAKYEVAAQRWADIGDNGYGLSLLNDCKYGYDALDNVLRLTLLRCGTLPNVDADREIHRFTYAILPHAGTFRDADTVSHGYDLNYPATCAVIGKGNGSGSSLLSMFRVADNSVVLETVKVAEDGKGYILRLYEPHNTAAVARIASPFAVKSASVTDLLERPTQDDVSVYGNDITLHMRPFEIATLRVEI